MHGTVCVMVGGGGGLAHQIHRARELLDRALVPHHLSLPERISKHVVIGLCSMDERTVGWLLQYVAALR